ncbi:MAG TPA: lytic polysaccharide monooxygenase [Cellvibrio sp.]|nr:lytic polysaccharide monooxygenase [Cellvibrio sp.]
MKNINKWHSGLSAKTLKSGVVSALIISLGSFLAATQASAHGYISSPKSRVIQCKENGIESPTHPACIAAKAAGNGGLYTPQEVAVGGVRDNHEYFIPDGRLCSANRANLFGMDLARADWPATAVTAGPLQFTWTNTAAHKTMYFRYYITKQGYNHSQPLRWSDLELIHDSGKADQEQFSYHRVNMPARTGRHIVYSIWQRDWERDSAEGFYQCVDVDYGNGSSIGSSSRSSLRSSSATAVTSSAVASSISPDTCSSLPVWNAATAYTNPQQVKHNNKRYQANYWSQGNDPATNSGQYSYWLDLGSCVTSGSSATSVAPASSSKSSALVTSSRAASSVATGSCTSPTYVNGATYADGALVQNGGSEYRCTVGGWCTVGGPYAPGTGWAWTNAWSLVRACN